MELHDLELPRRVIITGGSSGIGIATAQFFVEAGSTVGLIGRDPQKLRDAEARLASPHAVLTAPANVAVEDEITVAIESLAEDLGGVDAVICAAGIDGEMGARCENVTATSFLEVLQVNVLGTFLTVRSALHYLKKSSQPNVVIVGSDSGFVTTPGMLAYNASKGALVQLTRALAAELFDDYKIRVNSICPSIVDTPMARRGLEVESFHHVSYPVQDPGDLAWSIGFLTSNRNRAINGVNLLSDFGYSSRSSFPA